MKYLCLKLIILIGLLVPLATLGAALPIPASETDTPAVAATTEEKKFSATQTSSFYYPETQTMWNLLEGWRLAKPTFKAVLAERLKKLLKTGKADVNSSASKYAYTPLGFALASSDLDMVKLLLEAGANRLQVNTNIQTSLPIHQAASKTPALVDALLSQQRDKQVNALTEQGLTPLYYALISGNKDVVQTLLAHGADVSIKNTGGHTALTIAQKKGNPEIIKIVKDHVQKQKQEREQEMKKVSQLTHFPPGLLPVINSYLTPEGYSPQAQASSAELETAE